MYYYASFTTPDGDRQQGVFTRDELHAATFSPDTVIHYVTNLRPRSKQGARDMVIALQDNNIDTVNNNGNQLSYGELSALFDAVVSAARRFGLVREFRNEGII